MDPLLKKLQHKGDVAVTVLGAPDELAPLVAAWEGDGVAVRRERDGEERFVLCFVRSCAEIAEVAPAVVGSLAAGDSVLWFVYPKKSSKRYRSDVGRDDSWAPVGALGFEPVRQVPSTTTGRPCGSGVWSTSGR